MCVSINKNERLMQAKAKLKLESACVQESLNGPPTVDGLSVEESFKAVVKRVLGGPPGQSLSLWPNRETDAERGGVPSGRS